ncbi:MAG: hypothetical protein VB137_05105 [Burkholderia sp.]
MLLVGTLGGWLSAPAIYTLAASLGAARRAAACHRAVDLSDPDRR